MSITEYIKRTEREEREDRHEEDDPNVCHIKDANGLSLCFSAAPGISLEDLAELGLPGDAPICMCGSRRCPKCAAIWVELQRTHF